MLEVRFYNVGDGDAALLRLVRPGQRDYTILVDAGRPQVELRTGSRRRDCLTHLLRDKVDHLDLMMLTHLHIDHIGGAEAVLRHLPVGALITDYLPPAGAGRIPLPDDTPVKATVDLQASLNFYSDVLAAAREQGTALIGPSEATARPTEGLRMELFPAPARELSEQHAVFDALCLGEDPEEETVYRASKSRNALGLASAFTWAGVRIGLGADVYAEDLTARGIGPCRILKMPHHGDEKSAAPELLSQVRPEWAVISCQMDPPEKKHRPAAETLALLSREVPHTVCTENSGFPDLAEASYRAVGFDITDGGEILPRIE